jgi:hypothetical protein
MASRQPAAFVFTSEDRTMSDDNPYDPSRERADAGKVGPSTLIASIAAVFGSAFLGGLLGLGIGAALGSFVPGYYRSVFGGGDNPHFDPVAVGIGQGLTQGVVFGGVVGVVLVWMYYRYRSRQ